MESIIMRFYFSTLLTGSLVFLLVGTPDFAAIAASAQINAATPTQVQLITDGNGQPSHRGSGRKEFFELEVLTQQIS